MSWELGFSAVALLMGSLPFGLWVGRAFGAGDVRASGSGNIGATNVSRVAGFWPAGALTFLLDLAKGALPCLLLWTPVFSVWSAGLPEMPSDLDQNAAFQWVLGLCAVLGHCYTPWLKFKGGKGVATGFGVILVLAPWAALAGATAFVISFALTRVGSLASLTGLTCAAAAHVIVYPVGSHLWPAAALAAVILYRHSSNLASLVEGQERAF